MPRGGRSGVPVYTPELAARICERIAAGESVKSIGRSADMPSDWTVRNWALNDYKGFASQYARATLIRMHVLADEIMDIADNASAEEVQAARLRVDTRKWLMSKIAPKVYGDKLDLTHAAPDGGPVQFITIYEAKKEKS